MTDLHVLERIRDLLHRHAAEDGAAHGSPRQKLWQRRKTRIYFDDEDLDVYFALALGRAPMGAAEIGECFAAASRIDPKSPASWAATWGEMGERLEATAEKALGAGHQWTGRRCLLRAATYHRVAAVGLGIGPDLEAASARSVGCFRRAVALGGPQVDPIEIPFADAVIPGYFVHAETGEGHRPTILVFTGGEVTAEDMYFWVALSASQRGYHAVLFDPPGWAGFRLRNPQAGRIGVAELDAAARTVVDFAERHPGVDPERIAAIGFSGGGFTLLHAAVVEHRIAAIVADPPIIDMHRLATAEIPAALQRLPGFVSDALGRAAGLANPYLALTMEKIAWQFGVDGPSAFMELTRTATSEGRLGEITCPVLALAGEGESEEQRRQVDQVLAELRTPHRRHVFSAAEGAEAHTQVNNLSRMQEVALDWLDETLAPSDPNHQAGEVNAPDPNSD